MRFIDQFNKLTEAYIKDEVNPGHPCACFVGNLLNKTYEWGLNRTVKGKLFVISSEKGMTACIAKEAEGFYSPEDIVNLENLFMDTYVNFKHRVGNEEALFIAFEKTLDLLKQIHESKGEIIEPFEFKKRQLEIA